MSIKRLVFGVLARGENCFDLVIAIGVVDHQLALRRRYGARIRRKITRVGVLVGIELLLRSSQGIEQWLIGSGGVCEYG